MPGGCPMDLTRVEGAVKVIPNIMDLRYRNFANTLVQFSTAVTAGDRVLIDVTDVPDEMTVALIRSVRDRQGYPLLRTSSSRLRRELMFHGTEKDFESWAAIEMEEIKQAQCFIAIRGAENIYELCDIPTEKQRLWARILKPVHDYRVARTRWVIARWPNGSMAQLARRSRENFEDFFFRVCSLDYGRMEEGMAALRDLMVTTDRVEIRGPGTDLKFSIAGLGAEVCGGRYNIPDGEVFTAPVRNSVEGTIQYNTPSVYQGRSFDNVRFTFREGRIVEATANDTAALNAILDSDEGARYVGEFSFGFNPHIQDPICDILFDEKIAGSIHFTPGQAYESCDNGNRSQVHWDLVLIQRPEWGGGEVYFDGRLIRKDGLFVLPGLDRLNPDYLLR